MEARERNKIIDKLKPEVLKLPMSEVVDSRLHGSRLSPFRDDQNEGSFMVSDERGCCTDFVEGKTRNQITFIKDFDGVDFQEAVLRISCEFGLLEESVYKEASRNQGTFSIKKRYQPKEKPVIKQATRQSEENIDYVYRLLLTEGLNEEDREYLLKRGVPESELKNYCSYDNFRTGLMIYRIYKDKKDPKILVGVPGFYRDKDGTIAKRDLKGIGIPMFNADGKITAMQIRRTNVEKGQARYVFLSSRGLEEGCSSGAQVTIEAPEKEGDIWITEGQFKAAEIRRTLGCTAISVQGVNNTKPLSTEIPKLLKKRSCKRFVIAFDADLVRNPSVKKAAMKLKEQLAVYNISIEFATWDEKDGKGIDDLIQNEKLDTVIFKKEL